MKWLMQLFSRRRIYADLSEEIRQHIREKTDELTAAGMNHEEASATARQEFGNALLIEERARDAWWWRWIEDLCSDIAFGLRQIIKSPLIATVCIVTLAVGIGANTAVFSAVHDVLIRPLPFANPNQLVLINEYRPGNVAKTGSPLVRHLARARRSDILEETGGYWDVSGGDGVVFGSDNSAERLQFTIVTKGFFSILGIQPAIGRTFSDDEEQPGGGHVFLASEALWRRELGADTQAVGKTYRLDGEAYTLIGVLPAQFNFPGHCDVWMPIGALGSNVATDRLSHQFWTIGRLRPGVSVEQAQAAFDGLQREFAQTYPASDGSWQVKVTPLLQTMVGNVRTSLLVLFAAVGLVLLIACSNVINLLLTRASTREKEFAVRRALGAARLRLVRQSFTESLLIVLSGALIAPILARVGLNAIVILSEQSIPRLEQPQLSTAALAFSAAIALLTTLIVGVAPGFRASGTSFHGAALRSRQGGNQTVDDTRLRNVMVVVEVALAVMLLAGAGLMLRTFMQLRSVDPGFHTEHIVSARITLPDALYTTTTQRRTFLQQLLERLNASPGITTAAAIDRLPLSGEGNWGSINIVGRPILDPATAPSVEGRAVSSGYFHAMGIALLRGRDFTAADIAEGHRVTVINEALAEQFWPNADPLGQQVFSVYHPDQVNVVVGVVGNVKDVALDAKSPPEIYAPYSYWNVMTLIVRGPLENSALIDAVRHNTAAIDPQVPVYNAAGLNDIVSHSIARQRFELFLLVLFAAIGLFLAAVGIFGLLAFAVSRRTHEIGVRLALGARPESVVGMLVGEGLRLLGMGAAIGIAAALALTRLMAGLLYNVSPADPLTYAAVVVTLTTVGAFACYLPARRALKVDPMVALRQE